VRVQTRAAGVRRAGAETMLVRIRFGKGLRVGRSRRRNKRMALAVSALLTPAAFLASVLALWRIAADLNFSAKFAIASGMFSHWQVWLVVAVFLQVCSRTLARYGKRDDRNPSIPA